MDPKIKMGKQSSHFNNYRPKMQIFLLLFHSLHQYEYIFIFFFGSFTMHKDLVTYNWLSANERIIK